VTSDANRIQVLGLPVDRFTLQEACERVIQTLAERDAGPQPPLHVVTMNAEMAIQALQDSELKAIISQAGLVTPDGVGIVWAMRRRLGGQPIAKVAGIELVDCLASRSAALGYRIYLLGGQPGIPEAAAEALKIRYPGLTIVGHHHGYFGAAEESGILERIKETAPDILLVALGVPRQEKWISRQQGELKVPVAIGVGGSFDVFAGRVRRAPAAFQRLQLEWLYRVMQEPWRLKRLRATLPAFVYRVLTEPKGPTREEKSS
jgi:N-acetylglucosaminyldiphosphoundecaprenol N-acetyl-beta-D-mannosaminyltransferase